MSSTTINVSINDRTPELFQKLQSGVEKFVQDGADYIEDQLKTSMAEPKHGNRYGTHVASAPGESPAVDSGNLTGSIDIVQANTLEAKIGTPVEYAPYLEDGTHARATRSDKSGNAIIGPHRGGMFPRPLWARTAKESLPTLQSMLDKAIGRGQGGINIFQGA